MLRYSRNLPIRVRPFVDKFGFLIHLWFVHAILALIVASPIAYFGRQRISWHVWELLVFVLPFSIWVALMSYGNMPKSLSNLGEVINITIAIPVATLIRVAVGSRFPQSLTAAILVVLLCIVSAATYFLTPLLPE